MAICSEAAAADCTFEDDCSEAAATEADSCCVVSADFVRWPAAVSISVDADDTVRTTFPIAFSKPSAICSIVACRSVSVLLASSICSVFMAPTRIAFSLNT